MHRVRPAVWNAPHSARRARAGAVIADSESERAPEHSVLQRQPPLFQTSVPHDAMGVQTCVQRSTAHVASGHAVLCLQICPHVASHLRIVELPIHRDSGTSAHHSQVPKPLPHPATLPARRASNRRRRSHPHPQALLTD